MLHAMLALNCLVQDLLGTERAFLHGSGSPCGSVVGMVGSMVKGREGVNKAWGAKQAAASKDVNAAVSSWPIAGSGGPVA